MRDKIRVGVIILNSIYWLISANKMDSDYNHSPLFNNKTTQLKWFYENTVKVLNNSTYQRKNNITSLTVFVPISELKNCNYLIIRNSDGSDYFYFIVDKEYNDTSTTNLSLQLDLLQTYMFDIKFSECLIERQHSHGWAFNSVIGRIAPPNVIEDIDVGEYEVKSITPIYTYHNKGTYLIASSEMLGISDDQRPGQKGSGSSENYKNKLLDENGYLFMKSKEAFASTPYQDIYGYWTIGYGVTQIYQPTYYNLLAPQCTEQQASEIAGEIIYNFSSQIYDSIVADGISENWFNQNKLNAITSYCYQYGISGFQNTAVYQAIVGGQSDSQIYNIWYNTQDGFESRRQTEAEAFKNGVYPAVHIADHDNGGYITDNNGKGYIPVEYRSE